MSEQPIKIGYCLSLSGPLASNGKTARLAHQIWEGDVNRRGGLLGRPVQMVCLDDQTNPALVADLYKRLLDEEKVDLVMGGYGDNSVAPAMPLIMERERYLIALMALAVNATLAYPNYFVMIPTGPNPNAALTEGFFDLAARQTPKPASMAILAADAPFSKNPVAGAKAHAGRLGIQVVSEGRYPLATTDFAPLIRELEAIQPDILFLCSYLNDSAGLLRAVDEIGLKPKMVGGAMIGPQNGAIKGSLGPLLNGVVNYEYWLPAPEMMFPGIAEMIDNYQSRAEAAGADPLGYYVAPQAYAQAQVLEQAVAGTGSLDDAKLAEFTRRNTFRTILGDVKFGEGGGWAQARVLTVQYRNIVGNDLAQFRGIETQAVVSPADFASGTLVYPYANAKARV
ncbi:MAG: branched-chain amino acid ABC transporter substrate-binding protein [Phenylobacterium sp.]|nr:MAG: branched-chain amino acid ABC transporter substrate-binding protein [Phenylobacterium sp.]